MKAWWNNKSNYYKPKRHIKLVSAGRLTRHARRGLSLTPVFAKHLEVYLNNSARNKLSASNWK
jgi:hypothetical protein